MRRSETGVGEPLTLFVPIVRRNVAVLGMRSVVDLDFGCLVSHRRL